jgi:hypothetical protein
MANNRCFTTYNTTIQNASDYSTSIRQKTIYTNIASNMHLDGNANPVKLNGVRFNDNFSVMPIIGNKNAGCLVNAKNYELLLDATKGKHLYDASLGINTQKTKLNTNESWAGSLFSVNYSENGVNVVVDTSYNASNPNKIIFPQTISACAADLSFNNTYPGIIVDPSYQLFYNPCLSMFNNGKNPWLHLVDVSFNETSYYKEALQSDPYYNISFPEKVIFNCSTKN